MPESVSLLMIQFLDWVANRNRTYAEAMEAWRTSCPRLSVWEDALFEGLIQVEGGGPAPQSRVTLTAHGWNILKENQSRGLEFNGGKTSDTREKT
jgi:hypothetical protein